MHCSAFKTGRVNSSTTHIPHRAKMSGPQEFSRATIVLWDHCHICSCGHDCKSSLQLLHFQKPLRLLSRRQCLGWTSDSLQRAPRWESVPFSSASDHQCGVQLLQCFPPFWGSWCWGRALVSPWSASWTTVTTKGKARPGLCCNSCSHSRNQPQTNSPAT